MATILTKKKDTSGAPSAGDLTNSTGGAELAVNTADKRLYTKDSGGNVVEIGTNPTSITTGTLNTSGAVVFNDAGADVDFRVEGDTDANLLFVDASADAVGIGTSSPASFASKTLEIYGSSASTLKLTNGTTGTGNTAGIEFEANGNDLTIVNRTSSGYTRFFNNGSERMRIDSSGNVGIGCTPSAFSGLTAGRLEVGAIGNSLFSNGSTNFWVTSNTNYETGTGYKYATSAAATYYLQSAGTHQWHIAPSGTAGNAITFTQAMTLDASGNLLVGKTASDETTIGTRIGNGSASCSNAGTANFWVAYSTSASAYRFYVTNAGTVFATNTTISAISDQRLKENIRDLDVGLAEVMQLQPRVFDWKEGKGKDIQNDRGFIAQEFEQVFPNLVDEWKDPSPEGEEPYKSVRQDLIPVLVKAIQELKAELDTVKADLATLKG